jgi:NADPH-dependent glutamate synthase beta subunit-like oxidoreductase/NAD-dependent dihydropyrimidine dehydrogenase PreA subunit
MAKGVAIIGDSAGAAQAALTLAELGVEVKLIMSSPALSLDNIADISSVTPPEKLFSVWPLLLRAASHPQVTLHTNSEVRAIIGRQGKFTVRVATQPRYVREDLCTACGRCEEACSVQVPLILDGRRVTRSAIHAPVPDSKTIPSAYCIEKSGIAPCRAACPLGINVQGFVSLLSKGKIDEALSLINEVAPLAGVLGRVCTHPCEDNCKRGEVDSPVFIPALHRYAADNSPSGINYRRKAPARSRKEKIAIVGSGPAGLSAAWELARRGYSPTIFESHAVVGGMVATGIPRFRMPLEVREREVAAIKALGVDIKTGVTVGHDVTISDLRERGYRAFFLAIGAHENRSLGIPGEDLEGVVDAISLLFALNLKVGASVGSNVVVIGGGNSAVDSARTAKRRSKGVVRILYRRAVEEMTAVADEVEEAINEGISIEYLTNPLEILGDGTKVTGIRCQRMEMGDIEADGRRRPEPIPGSEFTIDADHVVIAIGQLPNTSVLNIRWLDIDDDSANIKVNPLTLETRIPGIFAGGDCVTGPNNVVEAVAAGLRAAESIDRYLRGRDLSKGRSLEKPQPVEVDVRERDAAYYKRARMPAIPPYKRMGRFEEIALGLPIEVGRREAERCLNCALCSECMECEQVCELGAVLHKDKAEHVDVGAELIINFTPAHNGSGHNPHGQDDVQSTPLQQSRPGIYTVESDEGHSLESELAEASAAALAAAAELRLTEEVLPAPHDGSNSSECRLDQTLWKAEAASTGKSRIGVFLCRCGGSINSVIDFNQVTNKVLQLPGVCTVQEIAQACSEEGANRIAAQAAEWKLDNAVLAACRCCGLDQICFSCTDRRVKCQQHLGNSLNTYLGDNVEFVNIREQCALVHEDDPVGATCKATDIVSAGVARARRASPVIHEERPLTGSALVLGAGIRGLAAAKYLAAQGYSITVVTGPEPDVARESQNSEYTENRESLLGQLDKQSVFVRSWPQTLELDGAPGSYNAMLKDGSQTSRIEAGTVILDLGEMEGEVHPEVSTIPEESRLGRIFARIIDSGGLEDMQFAIRETAGIFIISPDGEDSPWEQVIKGAAIAARASAYLCQGSLSPRANAVAIDSGLCRGCGDCAAICPYIEMRETSNGTACAYIDQALCLGCGVCIAHCPTGAITQAFQSDSHINSTLEALLGKAPYLVEVA